MNNHLLHITIDAIIITIMYENRNPIDIFFIRRKGKHINMEERRQINRVEYLAKSVIVVCDTEETIYVEVQNVSPLGMGIVMPADGPDILGKDIIIVAETLIMYAEVNRQEKQEDGTYIIGIQAKKFTPDVLEYLFTHIGNVE